MPPATEPRAKPGEWVGHMDRAPDGTITLWVADEWGWKASFNAERDPAGGYILRGKLGPVPPVLYVPIVDDPIGSEQDVQKAKPARAKVAPVPT